MTPMDEIRIWGICVIWDERGGGGQRAILSWTLTNGVQAAFWRIGIDMASMAATIGAVVLWRRRFLAWAWIPFVVAWLFSFLDDTNWMLGQAAGKLDSLWSWNVPGFFGIYPYILGLAAVGLVLLGLKPRGVAGLAAWGAAAASLVVLGAMLASPTPENAGADFSQRFEPFRLVIRIGNSTQYAFLAAWLCLLAWPRPANAGWVEPTP